MSSTSPETLLISLLTLTEDKVIPLTRQKVSQGNKLFGAAILRRSDLSPIIVATNNESESPLLHGEINCIQQFFTSVPKESRPDTKDCIFFATHEPCSLCLSGITWSGFDEFYYLFTYEDSRDLFEIPYDIDILQEVFRVEAPGDTDESLKARALYNRSNKFFTARSVTDLVGMVDDPVRKGEFQREVERIKGLYNALSETYQKGKAAGHESSSFFK